MVWMITCLILEKQVSAGYVIGENNRISKFLKALLFINIGFVN